MVIYFRGRLGVGEGPEWTQWLLSHFSFMSRRLFLFLPLPMHFEIPLLWKISIGTLGQEVRAQRMASQK